MTTLMFALAGVSIILAIYSQKKTRQLADKLLVAEESCRQQQEALGNYRSRDQQLFQNAGEALFVFDQADGSLLEINRQAEILTGYDQAEALRLDFKMFVSRESRQSVLRMIGSTIKQGEAGIKEVNFQRKDGSHFIGEIKAAAGYLNNSRVIYGSFRDITQITNLQIELRRQNRHLSLLNEISQRVAEGHDLPHTLKIILDEVVTGLAISGGGIFLLEQCGTEMKLAIHRNIPGDVVEELARMQPGMGLAGKVAQTGRPRLSTNLQQDHRRISSAVFADGWRAFLAVPFVAREETLGVLFIFDRGSRSFNREDVRLIQAIGRQLGPLLKNAELFDELQWQHRLNYASLRELERSRAALRDNLEHLEHHHRALQSLSQMKSTFLSLASHELRTPLTTILSGTEFLQAEAAGVLGESEKRALNVILRGGQRLNHIVDELLEAARLQAKSFYIARETFNPRIMIDELLTEFGPNCEMRNLKLELQVFPDDSMIRGDLHHLRRAFGRVMENAMKFTPEGGWVRIAGKTVPQREVLSRADMLSRFCAGFFAGEPAENYLEIAISDSGIGLEKEDQLRIFDDFHEVGDISGHSTSQTRFGGKGIGLGLTLAKGIIETHGGLIWVESAGPSQGSCFSALLPLADPDEGTHVPA